MLILFRPFLEAMLNLAMPGFFGIGQGPNKEEKAGWDLLNGLASYEANAGKNATSKATGFWGDIMSGDMDKIMRVLGPQISAIQGQGAQAKKTTAEFGTRSGGTNASMQMMDDRVRSTIDSMIGNLTGQAATNVGNLGMNLLSLGGSTGATAFEAAEVMQKQNAAKWGDIFNSISQVVGAVAGMPGMAGSKLGKVLTGTAGAIS